MSNGAVSLDSLRDMKVGELKKFAKTLTGELSLEKAEIGKLRRAELMECLCA